MPVYTRLVDLLSGGARAGRVALSLVASYVLQGWRSGKERGVVLLINTLLVAVLGAIFMSLPVELVLALVRNTP
jgi:hypothetical protein